MAEFYCDYSTGNDTTGNGTSGNPYKTLNKAISLANGGDIINLANTAAFQVTSPISWATFAATTPVSPDAPVLIRAWNNGGSITISHPTGNLVAAELNGMATSSTLFSTSSKPRFIYFERIKFTNTTSAPVATHDSWSFYKCEFYNSGGNALLVSDIWNRISSCIFRDSGAGIDGINNISTGTYVFGCYFKNIGGYAVETIGSSFIMNNIIKSGTEGGVSVTGARVAVVGNTIIGDGTASQYGVNVIPSSSRLVLMNNMITNHSGSSAKGINVNTSNIQFLGHNGFYNNTENMVSGISIKGVDLTSMDVQETSDPYVNLAGEDFALKSTALSKSVAYPKEYTSMPTLSFGDIGAVQIAPGSAAASRGSTSCC